MAKIIVAIEVRDRRKYAADVEEVDGTMTAEENLTKEEYLSLLRQLPRGEIISVGVKGLKKDKKGSNCFLFEFRGLEE